MSAEVGRRKARTVVVLLAVLGGMAGLVVASVPLYRLFCQVTGYGGTTQTAAGAPGAVSERAVTVQFNADVHAGLPWRFEPLQREVSLRLGETGEAFYRAVNDSDAPVVGTATFNVTPAKAGVYFSKIDCFCFTEQRLAAGEAADMGVTFFVDPEIAKDPNTQDVRTITLSYTFFRKKGGSDSPRVSRRADERPASSVN